MKNMNLYSIALVIACYAVPVIGMEYKHATDEHVRAVVDLMDTYAYRDSDKIVIVPKLFRTGYVQSAVDAGRLFVATDGARVIGYKKLFCVDDEKELNDILANELRCTKSDPVACGQVTMNDLSLVQSSTAITQLLSSRVTYIYNGADFTHPDYRGQGVNGQLTNYALNAVLETVITHIKEHKSAYLALAYGLTKENAGEESNLLDGRTRGIIKQFETYTHSIAKGVNAVVPSCILLSRHPAFKPSFDPDATECKPLADEKSIPGYGCLMASVLQPKS